MIGWQSGNIHKEDKVLQARCLVARALDLHVDGVDEDASIETLEAWDSLGHLRIVTEIEQAIGAELSGEEVLALNSIRDVVRLFQPRGGDSVVNL